VLPSVDFLTLEFLYAMLIIFAAGVVHGVTGFGGGLVMVPLLALLWGPVQAITIMVVLAFTISIQITIPVIPVVNWREIRPMLLAGLFFTPVGTALLVILDPLLVKKVIAAAVLFLTVISIMGWTYKGPRGFLPGFIAGAVGGCVNGVAAVGGPPMVLYLMSLPGDARQHRANIVAVISLMGLTVLASMLIADVITVEALVRIAVLALPFMASVWLGTRLFRFLPQSAFRLIVLWMLIALSVMILAS